MKAKSLTFLSSQTQFLRNKRRMSWFLVVLILNLTFSSFSGASHDKKLLPSVVVGTVYCDTCFQHDYSRNSHFIAGASVAVECKNGNSKPRFWKEVRTNEYGEFKVELPFPVSKHVRRMKGCTVKLIKSSEPHCSVASAATSSSLSLKARNQGEHTFSAGFFSFKPLQPPDLCYHNPTSVENSKEFNSVKTVFPPNLLPPPLQDPTTPTGLPTLPPLPEVPELPPLPKLPPLPPVTGIPLPPMPKQAQESKKPQFSDQKVAHPDVFFPPIPFLPPPLIPNPFQPPPLIPNPFQPPPLIPNPFQPPPLIPNPFQPPSPPPLIPNPFQPPSPPPLIPNPFQPPSPPPLIPNPFQPPPSSPAPLIPNPFQPPPAPPPAPLIPNPFQPPPAPPPPPAPLIPNPFQPPPAPPPAPPIPSPLFPFPPIPGLTPSPPPPPPPPPPFLPIPFPPLFPPRSPGHPPASSSKITSP